jgi:hypothetical protein
MIAEFSRLPNPAGGRVIFVREEPVCAPPEVSSRRTTSNRTRVPLFSTEPLVMNSVVRHLTVSTRCVPQLLGQAQLSKGRCAMEMVIRVDPRVIIALALLLTRIPF